MTFGAEKQEESDFSIDIPLIPGDSTYRSTPLQSPDERRYATRMTAQTGGILVPLSIFYSDASTLQILVKYLHDRQGIDFTSLANLLNRGYKTVWTTHALLPKDLILHDEASSISVPLGIFLDRNFGPLESLVLYLKGLGLRFSEIASLLKKDERTVWTSFRRAKRKQEAAP